MAINTNPTGIFPIAQTGSDTPYTFIANGESLTSTGGGVYIPLTDLEPYIPTSSVLDEAHVDADYRYLLLGMLEAHQSHRDGLSSAEKPLGFNSTEGSVQAQANGKLKKKFDTLFFYDTSSLKLESGS